MRNYPSVRTCGSRGRGRRGETGTVGFTLPSCVIYLLHGRRGEGARLAACARRLRAIVGGTEREMGVGGLQVEMVLSSA